MKQFVLCVLAILCTLNVFGASTSDTLQLYINQLQVIDVKIQTLQQENETLKADIINLNKSLNLKGYEIDSLRNILAETNNNVVALADSLSINISTTREQIQANSDNLNQAIAKKSQTGMWIFIVLALVVAAIAFIFGRILAKRGCEVASLSAKADKLNEEIVNRLSSEMSEMQSLTKQICAISTVTSGGTDTEQKLITTLADRITFMEMTLYKMDSSVRGHKQLSKSIKQMKDNLLANGYELVDMLGKDYHDGMKVTANFVEDENLSEGKQIITGIIKPQINYQGKMIQSAQITVSQNL